MNKDKFQQVLRRVILVPLGIAAILAAVLILGVQSLANRMRWVDHTDEVIGCADRLYRTRIDEETGLRAYLLTRDERFLQPLREGREAGHRLENQLTQLISDSPNQQASNQEAMQAYRAWAAFADESIAMAKAGQHVNDLELQLRGKELMDRYRRARTDFTAKEEQLRDERLRNSRRTLTSVNVGVIAVSLLVGCALAVFGRKQLIHLSEAFNTALDTSEANATEVREQKEWLQTTLRSIGDAVIATDAEGCVSFINPVAEALTGWTSPEAHGKQLAEVFRIINQNTRESVENPIEKVRRLNQVVGLANHTILISRTGQEFVIDDSGAPIRDADGTLTGIVLVFRDVTHQRDLEAALRANERLAVAGRLSASIAHEIHNPLDTVGNLLYMAGQQTANQPQLHQLIDTALQEVHRVTQISKNMLSLHRESRTPIPIKIRELLNGVVALIEETLVKGRRKIDVEHEFNGEIEGFPAELRQVFTNVIKNAVEATPEGGNITIVSAPTQQSGKNGVLVQVADNGSGIPEDMKLKLFRPFSTSKHENGSGLGLWISRAILEKHNGTIVLSSGDSKTPAGTTITIFLPLKIAAPIVADTAIAGSSNGGQSIV